MEGNQEVYQIYEIANSGGQELVNEIVVQDDLHQSSEPDMPCIEIMLQHENDTDLVHCDNNVIRFQSDKNLQQNNLSNHSNHVNNTGICSQEKSVPTIETSENNDNELISQESVESYSTAQSLYTIKQNYAGSDLNSLDVKSDSFVSSSGSVTHNMDHQVAVEGISSEANLISGDEEMLSHDNDYNLEETYGNNGITDKVVETEMASNNADAAEKEKNNINNDNDLDDEINKLEKEVQNANLSESELLNLNSYQTTEETIELQLSAASDEAAGNKSLEEDEKHDNSKELTSDQSENTVIHQRKDSTDAKARNSKVQEILDDWQEENADEDKEEDSVEMELQSLLNDSSNSLGHSTAKSNQANVSQKNKSASHGKSEKNLKADSAMKVNDASMHSSTPKSVLSKKDIPSFLPPHLIGRTPKNPLQDQSDYKQKLQSPRPGVQVPALHLTSQIASVTDVAEVLKERLKEKHKDAVPPTTADIVFVQKITQRLSSKLSGAVTSTTSTSTVQSSSTSSDSTGLTTKKSDANRKSSTSDNRDLLAILEGDDVDPDWSNLKQHHSEDRSSSSVGEKGSPAKLDPTLEKELAMQQLMEFPTSPQSRKGSQKSKKNSPSSKKTEKRKGELTEEESDSASTADQTPRSPHLSPRLSIEESRSGRKRKLTEKGRNMEQALVKRHKTQKIKVNTTDKMEKDKASEDNDEITKEFEGESKKEDANADNEINEMPKSPSVSQSSLEDLPQSPVSEKKSVKVNTPKSSKKLGIVKKDTPISKRKAAVKGIIRQRAANKKLPARVRKSSKSLTPKTEATSEVKLLKDSVSDFSEDKAKSKSKRPRSEIDRLLQDEGVVNILYDVEQPDRKKRLVPLTKSQKKIVDVEKAERELNIRAKLVKNAVLRLRGSASSKVSPRSRRNVPLETPQTPPLISDKKVEPKSPKGAIPGESQESTQFIIPAKIRNAADASRIIRRHSSSSLSSISSPRVSTDTPLSEKESKEEPETSVIDKSKKKDSGEISDKPVSRKVKKTASKEEVKEENTESVSDSDKNERHRRSALRSNANAAQNNSVKTKKLTKSRSSTNSEPNDLDKSKIESPIPVDQPKSSSNTPVGRKKGTKNTAKPNLGTELVSAAELKKLSNFKEINIHRHGNLVQIVLAPSAFSCPGIRNALTIEMMKELQDALLILQKDPDCRVVLLSSTGTTFCEGLDLSVLLQPNEDEVKLKAEELARAVRSFIKSLAFFNKVLVAGVQGTAVGLGATMLPLFDIVVASDKATFSTVYGKLGQIPEGAAISILTQCLGGSTTNELLLAGRVLTANEALRAGIVSRVLWPDKFQGELIPSLKIVSEQSPQSMESTKSLLRQTLRKTIDDALESETALLVKHWTSSTCQEAIKTYLEEKSQ